MKLIHARLFLAGRMYFALLIYVCAGMGGLFFMMYKLSVFNVNVALLAGFLWMAVLSFIFYYLSRFYFRPLYEFRFDENGFEITNVANKKNEYHYFYEIKDFIIKESINRGVKTERLNIRFNNNSKDMVVGEDAHSKSTNNQYREFKQVFHECYLNWKEKNK